MRTLLFAFLITTCFFCKLAIAEATPENGPWWFSIEMGVNFKELRKIKNYYDASGHESLQILGLLSNEKLTLN